MGLGCAVDTQPVQDRNLVALRARLIAQWEKGGIGAKASDPLFSSSPVRKLVNRQGLKPITMVMYAAAVLPGGES